MELLNLLEERVNALVSQLVHLRAENKRIMDEATESGLAVLELQEENRLLKDSLAQEQRIKDDVQQRIDVLLEKLKDVDNNA